MSDMDLARNLSNKYQNDTIMKTLTFKSSIAIMLLTFIAMTTLKAETLKNWPREIISASNKITIFQPEIESLTNDKMECRSAVIINTIGQKEDVYGAIWYNCRIATDRDERSVRLIDINIIANKFQGLDNDAIARMNSIIEREVPKWDMVMSLDELLNGLEINDQIQSEQLNNAAPEILFATTPTALILIDGDPILRKVENTNLKYVVNTPFFIVRDDDSGMFYLKGGNYWYTSRSIYEGWKLANNVPRVIRDMEKTSSSDDEEITSASAPANIVVSTTPAELIISNGSPRFSAVKNTSLLYMTNTDEDIMMDINTQQYYVLISGRWYRSRSLVSGNWTFIPPDELPADFNRIPSDSPVNNVLASISGTQESMEAVLETRIPQTAEIKRNSTYLEVSYDGEPIFENVRGTYLKYAVNTDKAVLFYEGVYYCCDNAVWFQSYSPYGPWRVAVTIPEVIMSIPPDNPLYNVRYVFIYDYTPDIVRMGYYQGYVHNYIYRGCVFYGTGYRYRPWYRTQYYSRPLTYGFNVHYNPFTGWGFSYGITFGGFNWIRHGDYFQTHHNGYWGPDGYRHGYYHRYNLGDRRGFSPERPRPPKGNGYNDHYRDSRATNNVYHKKENDQRRVGNTTYKRESTTSRRPNDMYSDDKGNVYKPRNGNWENKTNQQENKAGNGSTSQYRRVPQQSGTPNGTPSRVGTPNRQGENSTNNPRQNSNPTRQGEVNPTRQGGTTTRQGENKTNPRRELNEQYNSRERSSEKTDTYNSKKTQYQYTQPKRESTVDKSVSREKSSTGEKKSTETRSPSKENTTPAKSSEKKESSRQSSSSGSAHRR